MSIFKKERLALSLENPINQRAAIKASLDHKTPLINQGNGLFFVNLKYAKDLDGFLHQFISNSVNCRQGLIDRDDPKCDYILIYDVKEN